MNSFNAIGRVGKDAVTRQAGNSQVTGFSLAVDSGFGDKKQTLWLDCSAWGDRFAKVGGYITKGSQLGVTGELGTREHDGKTYLTLRVSDVTLVGGKRDDGERRPQQRQERQPAPADDFDDGTIPF
jgi:single-strand DNA-binding protein